MLRWVTERKSNTSFLEAATGERPVLQSLISAAHVCSALQCLVSVACHGTSLHPAWKQSIDCGSSGVLLRRLNGGGTDSEERQCLDQL